MKSLTFAETLHPETADVNVDSQNGPTTVWGTVMKEFRTDLPVAVPVDHLRQDEEPAPTVRDYRIPSNHSDEKLDMPKGGGCFYVEGLVGSSMTFAAVMATFGVEVGAAICYCLAAGPYYYFVADRNIPIFVKAIVMLIVHALMVADAVLLTVGLILTEILGWTTSLVTSIFTTRCCKGGDAWHLYIRKACHLTRWAFRGFHQGWALQRKFPQLEFGEEDGVDCDTAEAHEAEVTGYVDETPQEARKVEDYQA